MDPTTVYIVAFAIGVIAGLRAMSAPATVSWGAYLGWMSLEGSWLSFLGSAVAAYILAIAALGEIVNDKLPKTPSRKAPASFGARIVMGAVSGIAITIAGHQPQAVGAILGILGAVAGTLGGYSARTAIVKALKCPDWIIAICEDAIAVGGGLFLVSRI